MKLLNKVVVITGASRGLGLEMANVLAKEGAIVWATSRTAPHPNEIAHAEPGSVTNVQLDVTDEQSVHALFALVQRLYGRLDVLVNNAGVGVFKPVEQTSLEEWENVFRTNVTGLFLCSREGYKVMKAHGGRIINISSVSGYIPIAENGVYGASKFAVQGFSQICNEEWKNDNVRVSTIFPGAVHTNMTEDRHFFDPSAMLVPKDVADTVLDIASRPLHVRIDEVKILPPKGVL
ncbi:NADP-dependent 3-hydroxy acid dehydrogenase YdfG [Brevibacillus sp. AG162]|uniref:SDR family oxidoreductase n=1 Tax=Brevibacillus sp. AG162 TaxID=2572910 RepID=UPI001153BFFC|nr:SDR family oxidoreductase [Brevibacillus sp. AG162]TQK74275.1 NADP-dependent 3-hydroxy acid dehydrogenase YdfG [Brevibacillus sp. AG162]